MAPQTGARVILRNRRVRYVVAVLASTTACIGSFYIGLFLAYNLASIGYPSAIGILVVASIVIGIVLTAYIVKKLLVDYW